MTNETNNQSKRDMARYFNAYRKPAKGKCLILAYIQPLPGLVRCIAKERLAHGIMYFGGWDGQEIGQWFYGAQAAQAGSREPGPGGVPYQRFPDWEEVAPPGRPVPLDGPKQPLAGLSEEAIRLIQKEKLFFASFLYYGKPDTAPRFRRLFGDRYIPSLVMEADMGLYPYLARCHREKPFADRNEAYARALAYIKDLVKTRYIHGLSGSGVAWYQGAALSRQRRWDHELANGNFQLQTAFLRGTARQHNIPFTIYVAPMGNSPDGLWSTKADPQTLFPKVLNCTYFAGGKPDALLEHEWFCAWFAGADAVLMEAAEFYLFRKGAKPASVAPGLMADAARRLTRLAESRDFDRGVPFRPAGVLMDERHGWDFPSAPDAHNYQRPTLTGRKIWGVFDYAYEDIMVDNFFGALYPGYENGGDWGGERGDLVQTPYGDSFDILMSNAALKALRRYPVLFPVGRPNLTADFKRTLERYVAAGGTLVLNLCQVDYDWRRFLGVRFTPRNNRWHTGLGTLRPSDWSEWLDPRQGWAEERYHYERVQSDGAETLAVTEQGDPLVLRRRIGRGQVYLVTAHHLQEISGAHRPNGLLRIARFLIGHVLAPHQRLVVRGSPLHTMVGVTKRGLSVLVSNNSRDGWYGWISFPGMAGAMAKEWYAGERLHQYAAGRDLSVRLDLPGHAIRLLSVERPR